MNQRNTIKLAFAVVLLVLISISSKSTNGLGRLLNRIDNQVSSSKINFSFEVLDMNDKPTSIDLSNLYVFIEGDNGDKYIVDLYKEKKIKLKEMFDYNYDNLHSIVSQNYNIIIAKKIGDNPSFDRTKSFRELSDQFIKLYSGYNIEGEYKLIFPSNIDVGNKSYIDLNIYVKEIYGNKLDINSIENNLNKYINYNIFTKYYSELTKNKSSICTNTIVRINDMNNINCSNNIYGNNYIDNNIYKDSKYLSMLINNNPDNYTEILNDIISYNSNYSLQTSNKIDFNKSFNELNDLSANLFNGTSSKNIKVYYLTIAEENKKIFNYDLNNSDYVVVNIDCTDNSVIQIDNKSNSKIIYNFYKNIDGKKQHYDGEIFINNIGASSILLAPKAFVHSTNDIYSNIISYEYIKE